MIKPVLTIIICTFERPALLAECLISLYNQQDVSSSDFELLVVDNSFDAGKIKENKRIVSDYPECKYIMVSEPGLSIARNAGIRYALGEYVAFIDDDAVAYPQYVFRVLETIQVAGYDCFGGRIVSRWPYGRPRWLTSSFGNMNILLSERGELCDGYNWGGNIIFKKVSVLAVGAFPVQIGMKGKKSGYGAETLVQQHLKEKGYRLGYDPELIVYHAVLPHKLQLLWHIKMAYWTARDGNLVYIHQYNLRALASSVKNILTGSWKAVLDMIRKDDYYVENFILDICRPWAVVLGKLRAIA